MNRILLVFICCGLLAACGGRTSHPVEATTAHDDQLSCDHLQAELAVNSRHIEDLRAEKDSDENNNIGILVTTPLWMDFSDSEDKEIQGLQNRNAVLSDIIARKHCY